MYFWGQERKMKGKKRITADKLIIFEQHMPLIIKEKTTTNKMK
jgi:hypothetical protein